MDIFAVIALNVIFIINTMIKQDFGETMKDISLICLSLYIGYMLH